MQRTLISAALGLSFGMGAALPILPALAAATVAAPSVPAAASIPPADAADAALLGQARLWEARRRDDLALEALGKLLRTSPDHPQALAAQAEILLRTDAKRARQVIERLRMAHPGHPELARLEVLQRLSGRDAERLRLARGLARNGRAEDALAMLKELFPAGPPTTDLALEYWEVVADTRNGYEPALAALSRLAAAHPEHARLRLSVAELVLQRRPADPAALGVIRAMTRDTQLEKQARAAWRRAVLKLGPAPSSVPLVEEYLQSERLDDPTVRQHLAGLQAAIDKDRALRADPGWRAGQEGLALLDRGKLPEAEERLAQALARRPDDAELLGGFGLLRMREGRHAEAQGYFEQAQRRDPGSDRWRSLGRTARFWQLMREAGDAEDSREYQLAESKLAQARELDSRNPQALLALGRLRSAQNRVADAEEAYRAVLAADRGNADALQALFALYLSHGREADATALLARLPAAQRSQAAARMEAAKADYFRGQAQALLAAGKVEESRSMLDDAGRHGGFDPWMTLDLARLYQARGEGGQGEAMFADLLKARPQDAETRYAYALFLGSRGEETGALTALEGIPGPERSAGMAGLQRRLWSRAVVQRALALAAAGKTTPARRMIAKAEQMADGDPDLMLDFADARIDLGDLPGARASLATLAARTPPSTDWTLRHARLTASARDDAGAAALLGRIDASQLDAEQKAAWQDIRMTLALREADRLREAGRIDAGLALLDRQASAQAGPSAARLAAARARLLRAAGQPLPAAVHYGAWQALEPASRDAAIGRIEMLLQAGHREEARPLLDAQLTDLKDATPDQVADLIGALIDLQAWPRAAALAADAPPSVREHPRVLAYASELAQHDGRMADAIDYLRRSLAAQGTGIAPLALLSTLDAPAPGRERGSAPEALPEQAPGAAPANAGRYRRLAEMIDQSTAWFATTVDQNSRSGSAGRSQYDLIEIPLEYKRAQDARGRWTLRADLVKVDAGAIDLADSGARESFGSTLLCQPVCDNGVFRQQASGLALNAMLERGATRYDIGTTPVGFPVQTLIGGILHKGDLGPFGYSVDVSRRPLTGSLLSYAGTRDPRTGLTWGGVTANGIRLGLSLDKGERWGFWSSLGLHRLAGRNVEDNDRAQLMGGAILRAVNEDDRLLQFGLTGMVWRHSRNAGEYTFGHGGYYSPATFQSLSLPVTFAKRHARLSYALRAAVSVSRSTTDEAPYFPTDAGMQSLAESLAASTGVTPRYRAGDSGGFGFGRSLSLAWEYQADPRLFIGGRVELDRSTDYSPNRFGLYLRYALDRNAARPVALVPEAVRPTSQAY